MVIHLILQTKFNKWSRATPFYIFFLIWGENRVLSGILPHENVANSAVNEFPFQTHSLLLNPSFKGKKQI